VFDRIKAEFERQPISFIGSVASIIALLNLSASVPQLYGKLSVPDFAFLTGDHLVLGMSVFMLLEGSLASFFGSLFVRFRRLGPGYPFVLVLLTSLVSAWISAYNCFWIFTPMISSPDSAVFVFILTLAGAYFFAIYFMHFHFQQKLKMDHGTIEVYQATKWYNYNFAVSCWSQTLAFVFISIYYGIKIFLFTVSNVNK
jgi:hypothetical protein